MIDSVAAGQMQARCGGLDDVEWGVDLCALAERDTHGGRGEVVVGVFELGLNAASHWSWRSMPFEHWHRWTFEVVGRMQTNCGLFRHVIARKCWAVN